MTFSTVSLFFPIVLAIHNVEEYSQYDNFARTFRGRLHSQIATGQVARDSYIYLTLSATVVSALTYLDEGPVLLTISQAATLALMLNGIGHCVLSIKQRTLIAGTLSAIVLVLPYSAVAVIAMRKDLKASFSSLLRCAVAGAALMPFAILASLWGSYALPLHGSKKRNFLQ